MFSKPDSSKVYVIPEKASCGLRSAGLSWQKHLAGLLAELGLFPSLIEPTLYKAYWGDILVLCLVYVDDILLATKRQETNQQLLDFLTRRLKVKLTDRVNTPGRRKKQPKPHSGSSRSTSDTTLVVKTGRSSWIVHVAHRLQQFHATKVDG